MRDLRAEHCETSWKGVREHCTIGETSRLAARSPRRRDDGGPQGDVRVCCSPEQNPGWRLRRKRQPVLTGVLSPCGSWENGFTQTRPAYLVDAHAARWCPRPGSEPWPGTGQLIFIRSRRVTGCGNGKELTRQHLALRRPAPEPWDRDSRGCGPYPPPPPSPCLGSSSWRPEQTDARGGRGAVGETQRGHPQPRKEARPASAWDHSGLCTGLLGRFGGPRARPLLSHVVGGVGALPS